MRERERVTDAYNVRLPVLFFTFSFPCLILPHTPTQRLVNEMIVGSPQLCIVLHTLYLRRLLIDMG